MFEIKNAIDNQFFFVLKARNGEVIATSEMYHSKQGCYKGISSVKRSLFAAVKDLTGQAYVGRSKKGQFTKVIPAV